MREKIYFHHISHVMVSFCVFVLGSKLAGLLFSAFSSFDAGVAELLSFLFAAACAVLVFKTFELFVPSPEENAEAQSVLAGRFKRRPFSMARYVLETIPHTVLTTALLIAAMYLVTVSFRPTDTLVNAAPDTGGAFAVLSLFVVHPLGEEYLFRGLYYGKLRSMSPIFACLMQAVMFAISHNGVGSMVYALIAGVILGMAAERSNGIAVPVVAHMLINLRTYLCTYVRTGVLADETRFAIDMAFIAAGVLAAGVLLLTARLLPSYGKPAHPASEREEAEFDD